MKLKPDNGDPNGVDKGSARINGSVAVLVVSCDRYADLWAGFFHCFFKYWPDCPYKVYLGTNHLTYADSRVRTLTIGPDVSYSDNLRAMLEHIPEEWLIFWIEDRFLSAQVNNSEISRLLDEAIKNGAAYLKLMPEHPLAYHVRHPSANIGNIPTGTRYRVSMTIALWHKPDLLALLRPGESAWELEKIGSRRSDNLLAPFMALAPRWRSRPPFPHEHVVVKGRLIRASLAFLRREGLAAALSGRRKETHASVLYTWAYHIFFRRVRPMQHFWYLRRQASGSQQIIMYFV
jgi:hypothetical protein